MAVFANRARSVGAPDYQFAMGDMEASDNPLWESFDMDAIPVLMAFRDGEMIWRRDCRLGVGLVEGDLEDLDRALA